MAKKFHRQRFASPIDGSKTTPDNVVPLRDPEKLYGAFVEKDDAGLDRFVFRFADKGPSNKPDEIFGAASWITMQQVAKPFGDAVFALVRKSAHETRGYYIAYLGYFLKFLYDICIELDVDVKQFYLIQLTTWLISLAQVAQYLACGIAKMRGDFGLQAVMARVQRQFRGAVCLA